MKANINIKTFFVGSLLFVFTIVYSIMSPIKANATDTIAQATIAIPGCNATFKLNNVDGYYGYNANSNGAALYEFYFPISGGSVSCDCSAYFSVVGIGEKKYFVDETVHSADWTFEYNTVNGKGSAVTGYNSQGAMIASSKETTIGKIVFCVGSDSSAFRGVLKPVSELVISTNLNAVSSNTADVLKNYTGNNEEFNAYHYYCNNVDLQVAIGIDGDALLKHWKEFGKAEGRVANCAK